MSTINSNTLVHLIGGSTLDDYYSMLKSQPNEAKRGEVGFVADLQKKLGDKATVISHAFAGFTTQSILQGDTVGKNLAYGNTQEQEVKHQYLAYRNLLTADSCHPKPLVLLEQSVTSQAEATHYVVIDVGADDMEGYWDHPTTLLDIRNLPSRVVEIVGKVVAISDKIKPIIVIHPRPHHNDSFTRVMGHVARAAAGLNVLAMLTFAASAFLSVTKRVSRVKGAVFCLAAAGLFQAMRTYIAPLKVTMRWGDINFRMINSIWERLYRPILCHAKTDNFHILDLASSHHFYNKTTVDYKKMLIDGIHEALNGEQKKLVGPKLITLAEEDKYSWVVNKHPETWTPTFKYV